MGVLTGIDAMKKKMEEADARFSDGPKVVWVKVADGKSVKIRPVQELDESASAYDKERGLGVLSVEHSHPDNYMRKGQCSIDDEGACWACEQGWSQSLRLYLNVEVDNGSDDPFIAVMNQGSGPKSVTPILMDYAGEGNITDKVFKLSRKGSGKQGTNWNLILLREDKNDLPTDEVFDLSKIIPKVPYDQQEAHYNKVWKKKESSGLDEFAKSEDKDTW